MERRNERTRETKIDFDQKRIYQIVERLNEKRTNELYRLLIHYRRLNTEYRARHGKGSVYHTAKIRQIRKELEQGHFKS